VGVTPAPSRNMQARRNVPEPSPPGKLSDSSSDDVCKAQGLVEARKPAWKMLELENPDHLECHYCRELHPIDKIHEYTYLDAKAKGPCWKINHQVRTANYIHPNFSLTVFRMVMKQYRQGKNCDKLLELLAYRSGAVMEGAQVKQVVATPKIVGERLLMRV
jgi:hypothetical protein